MALETRVVKEITQLDPNHVGTVRFNEGKNYAVVRSTNGVPRASFLTPDDYKSAERRLPNKLSDRVLDLNAEEVGVFAGALGAAEAVTHTSIGSRGSLDIYLNVVRVHEDDDSGGEIPVILSEEQALRIMYGRNADSGVAEFKGEGRRETDYAVVNQFPVDDGERKYTQANLIFILPTEGNDLSSRAGIVEFLKRLNETFKQHYQSEKGWEGLWQVTEAIEAADESSIEEQLVIAHLMAEQVFMKLGMLPTDIPPQWHLLYPQLNTVRMLFASGEKVKKMRNNAVAHFISETIGDLLVLDYEKPAAGGEPVVTREEEPSELDLETAEFRQIFKRIQILLEETKREIAPYGQEAAVIESQFKLFDTFYIMITDRVVQALRDDESVEDLPILHDAVTCLNWLFVKRKQWWEGKKPAWVSDANKYYSLGENVINRRYTDEKPYVASFENEPELYSRQEMAKSLLQYLNEHIQHIVTQSKNDQLRGINSK